MRALAQVSDLHFGAEDPLVAKALLADLKSLAPDLLVVCGDLTQRARTREFVAAAKYLAEAPSPQIVVPGNHDIPLYNLYRRFRKPLRKFSHAFPDARTEYVDDEIAVVGLNTARSLTIKGGRISVRQIFALRKKFEEFPDDRTYVLAVHHNILPHPRARGSGKLGRAERLLKAFAGKRLDLALAGHLHRSEGEALARVVPEPANTVFALSGVSISDRTRREGNSYNLVRVERGEIEIERRVYRASRFIRAESRRFTNQAGRWRLLRE
jgi:3',5'-cyclic AMP phosphodiesterase CpdA